MTTTLIASSNEIKKMHKSKTFKRENACLSLREWRERNPNAFRNIRR